MKLPNLERATISREKLVEYLLSATHRDGRHKAAFFREFGFNADNWQDLRSAILRHAGELEVTKQEESPFGVRYVVEGIMVMADGRNAVIRTVWFIGSETSVPRFVTAYPR